jgi:lysophospholipase L1-like esterase
LVQRHCQKIPIQCTSTTKENIVKVQIVEQVELFTEAELKSLEFVPEELEIIEEERVPDLDSISFEDIAEDLEAVFDRNQPLPANGRDAALRDPNFIRMGNELMRLRTQHDALPVGDVRRTPLSNRIQRLNTQREAIVKRLDADLRLKRLRRGQKEQKQGRNAEIARQGKLRRQKEEISLYKQRQEQRRRDERKPARATPNPYTIMPLGASITAGVPLGGGYRIKLWQTAQKQHWNINFVGSQSNGPASLGDKHHEGYSGFRIDRIARLVNNKLATYKPQIVLLYIGTNDAVQNHDIANAPRRLQSLIEQIFRALPNVQLLVAKLGPTVNPKTNANIQKINAAIPGIVRREQAKNHKIQLVDMSRVLTTRDLGADGIHPTPQGYDKMADRWARAMQPLLKIRN